MTTARTFHPVVIAGGSGTRLWPVSRKMYPKQFLPLVSQQMQGNTMLQETLLRASEIDGAKAPIVVCNEEHRFIAAEQLHQLGVEHAGVLLEPEGRNTAPAIAIAALRVLEVDGNSLMLVLPADHHIADHDSFVTTLNDAVASLAPGQLVTFGIQPEHAATGYGYIRTNADDNELANEVQEFVEKPDAATAQKYLDSGDYFWNSGMFLFHPQDYLDELKSIRPDIYEACVAAWKGKAPDLDFIRVDKEKFLACDSESIDYAVMEKTDNAYVVGLNCKWSDVGGWSALSTVLEEDKRGNVSVGDVLLEDCDNSYIRAEDKLVAALGVEDIVVVDTKDALLVASKDRTEDVKKIVEHIRQSNIQLTNYHRVVYRPWGHYDSIDNGDRYQVKRISVKPGAKLSVQMHHHRAEHWIVVNGTAKVRVGEQEMLLGENESVYIPMGETHSLENPGKIALELIEVQSGAYLGEDDIVRFEDRYGRS